MSISHKKMELGTMDVWPEEPGHGHGHGGISHHDVSKMEQVIEILFGSAENLAADTSAPRLTWFSSDTIIDQKSL